MHCWEEPGCGGELSDDCPHFASGLCPRTCMYTQCERPTHKRVSAMETFAAADVDFSAAQKETCHTCAFFLTHAPKI